MKCLEMPDNRDQAYVYEIRHAFAIASHLTCVNNCLCHLFALRIFCTRIVSFAPVSYCSYSASST